MDGQPLTHKVVLVTGASRGIGQATARLFAQAGAAVLMCSRSESALEQACVPIREAGREASTRVADIGSIRQVRGLVQCAIQRYGGLDIVINNAGVLGPRLPLTAYPVQDWKRVIHVNLTGTYFVAREAARVMTSQHHGCIVNLSSSVGRAGRALWGAYAVSKFGVEGMTQVMAEELDPHGVRIITFNPGGTRTAMRAEAYPDEDPNRLKAPSDVAEALLRLVTCDPPAVSGYAYDFTNLP